MENLNEVENIQQIIDSTKSKKLKPIYKYLNEDNFIYLINFILNKDKFKINEFFKKEKQNIDIFKLSSKKLESLKDCLKMIYLKHYMGGNIKSFFKKEETEEKIDIEKCLKDFKEGEKELQNQAKKGFVKPNKDRFFFDKNLDEDLKFPIQVQQENVFKEEDDDDFENDFGNDSEDEDKINLGICNRVRYETKFFSDGNIGEEK